MADTEHPENPTGGASNEGNQAGLEMSFTAANGGPSTEATSGEDHSSVPAVGSPGQTGNHMPDDTALPSIDSSIPPVDPSLSAFDTSLPHIDTTLPAIDSNIPASAFDETHDITNAGSDFATGPAPGSSDGAAEQPDVYNSANPAQVSSNGTYPTSQQASHQPQQQQAQSQSYQQNPGSLQNGQPSMNTGSMQTDGHPAQGQHIPQAPIGSPVPTTMPSMASMGQYMTGFPTNAPSMGVSPNAPTQYQMQGDANRMLSGKHKKEVKRRTKTGCMTCRKRRIKCDEGHPVCRNCVKSKRDCMGYDPVFRPPPTPSAIQPAPNPSPSLVVNPQEPPSYSPAPPGYMPAGSHSLAPSISTDSPPAATDHASTVDPTLEESHSPDMAGMQNTPEGALQSAFNPTSSGPISAADPSSSRLKQVRVSDLLALNGVPPPPPHPIVPLQQTRLDEVQAVFLATYAEAIDRFLGTRFFEDKALPYIMRDTQLVADYSALIDAFSSNMQDPSVVARAESFEASVIWNTMCIIRQVASTWDGELSTEDNPKIVAGRLNVLEVLITGEHVDANLVEPYKPLPRKEPDNEPTKGPDLREQMMKRGFDFWYSIGHFLTLHDNEASSAKEIDDTLARCRTMLDNFENRDVIYSVAIARHLGQRWADFPHSLPQPITTDEKDAGAKLYVAQKFLENQASGKGTTQVVKRVCGMVVRSWYISRE